MDKLLWKKLTKALHEQSIARVELEDGECLIGFIREIGEEYFEIRCRSYIANNLHMMDDNEPADLKYSDRAVSLGSIYQFEGDSSHSLLPDQLNGLLFHKQAISKEDWRGKELKGKLPKKEEEPCENTTQKTS